MRPHEAIRFALRTRLGIVLGAGLALATGCADVGPDYVAANLIQCDMPSRLAAKGYGPAVIDSWDTCVLDLTQDPRTPLTFAQIRLAEQVAQPMVDCAATPNAIGIVRDPALNEDGSPGPAAQLNFCLGGFFCNNYRNLVLESVADDICALPKDTL